MQYFTVIALLVASLSGAQAGDIACNNPNFNTVDEEWPRQNFDGRSGSVATAQQVCSDINGDFKSDEEKWDCRPYGSGDLKFKTSIKKVGQVNTELDGKLNVDWCKSIMEQIVNECDLGGSQEVSNWKFSTQASSTECGK